MILYIILYYKIYYIIFYIILLYYIVTKPFPFLCCPVYLEALWEPDPSPKEYYYMLRNKIQNSGNGRS
jgi:hypothetical protein